MLRGIYTAAAGMASQLIRTDTLADNMANLGTTGFKTESVQFQSFSEALLSRISGNRQQPLGTIARGSQVRTTTINFAQGDLVQTDNPLDLAIQGKGFFAVNLKDGSGAAYTRAGNFVRDQEGYLTTLEGHKVQGTGGDIQIPASARKIQISSSGDVVVDGQPLAKLNIVDFEDTHALTRKAAGIYITDADPNPVERINVQQGYLEQSNANVITEMVNSIEGLRIYETLQKSIQLQNETLGKSVNDVGRVI